MNNFPLFLIDSYMCDECEKSHVDDEGLWPDADTFNTFLPDFLIDNPCETCAKGGHPAYGQVFHQHPCSELCHLYSLTIYLRSFSYIQYVINSIYKFIVHIFHQ